MSAITAVNVVLAVAVLLMAKFYEVHPAAVDEKRSWELDIKKAKTVARFAANGKVLSRRKRGWGWWGEDDEEEEERGRERTRACQSRCWGSWGAATACSVRCGRGGQRTRYRSRVRTDCTCPGPPSKTETCGNSCQNGGTPRTSDCNCPAGFTNDCCETRVTCGNPGSPAHGSVSPSGNTHYYNTKAHYSCDSGWEVSGGTNPRTCQNNGQWSGSIPGCIRVTCPHPGTPQDGSVAPFTGFVYETLVQFSCNPGFSLQGSQISTCQSNRQWSHSPPICNRISCGDPGQIPDGTVTGTSYKFEDIITYSCDPGFTLIGSSERQCQADGTWSCNTPRCTSSVSLIPRCPTLNQISHGSLSLSDDNYYQSMAEYACDEGYYLDGESRRACQADEQWSGSEPTCNRVTCPRLTAPANGQVTQPTGSPEYGSQASFTCNSGYRLDGDDTARCEGLDAVGTWSSATPVCQAVDCGAPDRPVNGRIVGTDYTFQHTVQVQCGAGFYLQGSAELTCNENAVWVGGEESPVCIECPLDYYKSGENAASSCTRCPDHSHTVSTTSNNILQCTCDEGYEGPDGGPCTIVTCPVLASPDNGIVDPCGNEYESGCSLSCNPGYTVNAGDLTRQCQATGFWSGEPLKCSACPKDTYQEDTYFCSRCPDNSVTSGEASVFSDCTCADGFQSSAGGQECEDINECSGDHPCQQVCVNLEGGYKCECMPGWILDGLPDSNPTDCVKAVGTCRQEDLIPPANGGLVCGVVNVYEEYCSPYCNPDHEIIVPSDEYIECSTSTGWQWSHVLSGTPLPICTFIIFAIPTFGGTISYFEAECAGMTDQEKDLAKNDFIAKLEGHGVCSLEPGGNCQVQSLDIICGEVYQGRKKRQASTDTLNMVFNFTINVDFTQCTEVNCAEKYDKLVQTEEQRIKDELEAATQLQEGETRCPLCISDPDGNPLQMDVTGGVQVACPDGHQQKGYSCRRCAAGMFHNKEKGECELCPAGQYQPQAAQTSCLSCPYLTALDKRGATKCPVPPEDTHDCQTKNPCLAATNPDFKMYYSHTNANKFIQCTGHAGGCYEMPCPATLIWNPKNNVCVSLTQIPLTDIY